MSCLCRRCTANVTAVLICCTAWVLNTENRLNVELQFEVVDFCASGFVFCRHIAVLNILFGWPFGDRTIITPDVAYGCDTWPSRLTDEQRLKVFESGVMRKIF